MSKTVNSVKAAPQRMRKFLIVRDGARPKVRLATKFKFKKLSKQRLHTAQVRLGQGGRVKVEAVRNPGEGSNFVPSASAREEQGNWECDVHHWNAEIITRESVVLNPNFHALYPGAAYDYESIAKGEYETLPFARKPLMITVDGVNFSKPAVRVANPSKSSVAQAIATIKGSQRFQPGTRTVGTATKVTSEEDLFIQTGGSGYFLGFGGAHQFDFKSNRKSHKYFLDIAQAYYTVSVDDTVHEPEDFLVTKTEQPDNPKAVSESQLDPNWVFVDSITYGRILQVMIESDRSFESVGLNVEAHADFLAAGGQGTLTTEQKNLLDKATITVAALGGRGDLTGRLVNASAANLRSRIDDFFSGTDDEVPIAYGLRTLDGAVVGTRMTTEFTSRQCAPVASFYKVTWKNVVCKVSDDQNSLTDAEETKVMARVRAFNGAGKEILDEGRLNATIIEVAKASKKTGLQIPLPWTFSKGNEDHPLVLSTGEVRDMSQHSIKFAIPPGDKNAKIGIRADVLEFDTAFDSDDFTDENKAFLISEIGSGKQVSLLCADEDSRIQFNFTIEPVFEE